MQKRGRIAWSKRVRVILLFLFGISIILWLSLGILLIVRADSPQNDTQSSTLFGYRDLCIQCHRRVFIENNSTFTHRNPSGWNISEQNFSTVHQQANLGGSPIQPVSLLPQKVGNLQHQNRSNRKITPVYRSVRRAAYYGIQRRGAVFQTKISPSVFRMIKIKEILQSP